MWWWDTVPMKEVVKKEMDRDDMDSTLDNVENGYRLCLFGDLNG